MCSQQRLQCHGTACSSATIPRAAAVAAGPHHSVQSYRSPAHRCIEGSSGALAEVRQRPHTGDSEGQQLLTVIIIFIVVVVDCHYIKLTRVAIDSRCDKQTSKQSKAVVVVGVMVIVSVVAAAICDSLLHSIHAQRHEGFYLTRSQVREVVVEQSTTTTTTTTHIGREHQHDLSQSGEACSDGHCRVAREESGQRPNDLLQLKSSREAKCTLHNQMYHDHYCYN